MTEFLATYWSEFRVMTREFVRLGLEILPFVVVPLFVWNLVTYPRVARNAKRARALGVRRLPD